MCRPNNAQGLHAEHREDALSEDADQLPGQAALDELAALRDRLFLQVAPAIQWPEPSATLDLASRRGSETRMFKHLQQSCLLHREHFWATSRIRHLSLIDAYLDLARSQNGMALYIVARSMFELSAFLHEVRSRLIEAAGRADKNWREAGEMFFGTLVRARFATSREDYKALLRDSGGLSPKRLEPFNITHCIRGLAEDVQNNDALARYDFLCDFVHHNLASATTANAGSAMAEAAYSSGGGISIMPSGGTITQYEYPLPAKYIRALNDTGPGFLRDAYACARWMNETPEGPYPTEMVMRMTGTPFGVPMLTPPASGPRPKGSERNQPCPCGSGLKYKRCCAAAS
jgi:hypothetical protein